MDSTGASFWIGYADIDNEGEFMWQSSTQTEVETNFEAWGKNQPDGGGLENCVAAIDYHYYFW